MTCLSKEEPRAPLCLAVALEKIPVYSNAIRLASAQPLKERCQFGDYSDIAT